MKKTYINPEAIVVRIAAKHLLAGSPRPGFDPTQSSNTMDVRGDDGDWEDDEEF